jgi:hypothetical protein
MWSFSAYRSFQACPRQWYYKSVYANSRAKDPLRKEAYRLSKLESIAAWRGKIVDSIISDNIIPSIQFGRSFTFMQARVAAKNLFDMQKTQRMVRSEYTPAIADEVTKFVSFYELEYGGVLTTEMFESAWADIDTALNYLYHSEILWQFLRKDSRLIAQRPLSFKQDEISIRVVPDLIIFHSPDVPIVLDWKVNTRPLRDYWLQLITGAIALTRCKPHRDWPAGAIQCSPQEIQLIEVQLLAGDIRLHKITEADVTDAEDFISISAMEMFLAGSDENSPGLQPSDYSVAHEPYTCQICNFRKICWEK